MFLIAWCPLPFLNVLLSLSNLSVPVIPAFICRVLLTAAFARQLFRPKDGLIILINLINMRLKSQVIKGY